MKSLAHYLPRIGVLALLMVPILARAGEGASRSTCVDLGDLSKLTNWAGLRLAGADAILAMPGEATFRYPEAASGDDVGNWYSWYGVRFDVRLDDNRPVDLDVILRSPDAAKDHTGVVAHTMIAGQGWHTVTLPWASFDFPQTFSGFLGNIKEMSIAGRYEDAKPGTIVLRKAQLVRAEAVWLHADQRGRSVEAGGSAEYSVTVGNCTDGPQAVSLSFQREGFEAMTATVEPKTLQLAAGATADVVVRVTVPARVPPGGNETQTLRAIANGVSPASATISLITASQVGYPNILHTAKEWEDIRDNVKKYDWAKTALQAYTSAADKWNVPQVAKNTGWLFPTQVEHELMASGISYQITLDSMYADKVRTFLLRLSSPEDGYPITHRACNQASVQEGHFFQHIAMAYDMTIPSGVFTEADRKQIDATLRLFIGPEASFGGNISNWNVSSQSGALYCALVLQDLASANRILYGQGALIDQLRQGTLDDGWWYECAISYNVWCATEFSQIALAMRPWGLDLAHMSFPAAYRPSDAKPPSEELYGMSRARWGPIYNNSINIKRMWDALPPMLDYRGVIFGLNDSAERQVGGAAMDIAYYLYRDPAYAAAIRHGGDRDLLYAVPDLPDSAPDLSRNSAFADNAGVVVLRSHKENRPQREQIQSVLHYGDHGWFHGHFDQTDLLHLSRYGRSFFNPEMIWYGYPNFMYKFYVQTSVSKNMVVVDQKMQEPTESRRLLFHTGKMMQATAVQTNARWSNPPYGGMVYGDQPFKTFAEKALAEGRSVPVPENSPAYGAVTGYTEPVLQRRLMIVTDDYVVLADYLRGEQEHTFDSLLQMKAFQGLDAAEKKLVRHTGQWNSDPLGSAQFVTDCDWYNVTAPARGSYEFRWGTGGENPGTNDPGVLKLDVHTLWPAKQQIMIGTAPESDSPHQQVSYAVRGDGKTLAEGKSGVWILGQVDIDVPVDGLKSLELETRSGGAPALFWANARVVTADGKELPLSQLPIRFENTLQPKEPGKDYAGGPIKIVGVSYPQATPAQPQDSKKPAIVRVDLAGLNAARFQCSLGGDWPIGDETQRRKTMAERVVGKEARFLTVIEPYESDHVVKRAEAISADKLRVELLDGRVQEIEIRKLEGSGKDIGVQMTEIQIGQAPRVEQTQANEN